CGLSAPRAMPSAMNTMAKKRRSSRMRCGQAQGALVLERQRNHGGDPLAQLLAGLEVGNVLAGQRNGFARLGIASGARRPEMQREAAEAADLDPFAVGER